MCKKVADILRCNYPKVWKVIQDIIALKDEVWLRELKQLYKFLFALMGLVVILTLIVLAIRGGSIGWFPRQPVFVESITDNTNFDNTSIGGIHNEE